MRQLSALAVAALASSALLTGCASDGTDAGSTPVADGPVPGETFPGIPDGLAEPGPGDDAAGAAWSEAAGVLYVVTLGSSSCPTLPLPDPELTGDVLQVTFEEPGDGPCTTDLAPTTTVVAAPDGTPDDADLRVQLGDLGEVTLPAQDLDTPGPLVWVP